VPEQQSGLWKEMNNMNGQLTRGLLLGIPIGAAIGISVGMLYAPHSGRVTRRLIEERISDTRHEAERIVEDAGKRARHVVKDARSRIGR
jgi:gas vesicle protein